MCCHVFQNYKFVQIDPATVKNLHVYGAHCSGRLDIVWTTKWKHRHWLQVTKFQNTQLVIFIEWLVAITYLVSLCV